MSLVQQANSPSTNTRLYAALGWLVTLLVPVAIVLTAIRALLFPWFLPFEYHMPGFPSDSYGFTLEDRLYWSRFAMDYLVNDAGIEYLGDLRFADGSPVYNERELHHMVDVKIAIKNALAVWLISLVVLVGLGLWAHLSNQIRWKQEYLHGLGRGGWLTVFLVGGVIVFVVVGFGVFFVAFHNMFFEPGTWMFFWSDTLIRLFPERFWRDIFIYVGLISAGLGWLLAVRTQTRLRKR